MPGGRGISFYPSGRWTRSCSAIRPSASRASSRPVRPVFRAISRVFGPGIPASCFGPVFFLRPSGCFGFGFGWFSSGFFFLVRLLSVLAAFLSCMLCFSLLHLSCIGKVHRRRAGRNGARPPTRCELGRAESPVSCWESSSARPGSRRVGGAGAIVTPSKPRIPRSLSPSYVPAIGCRPPNEPRPFRQCRGPLGGFCFSFTTNLKR